MRAITPKTRRDNKKRDNNINPVRYNTQPGLTVDIYMFNVYTHTTIPAV